MSEHIPTLGILASGDRATGGGGSTAERFIRDMAAGIVRAEVGVVICNNPRGTVAVYDRVEGLNEELGLGIELVTINSSTHPKGKQDRGQTLAEASAICEVLADKDIDFLLSLGYMKQGNGELVEEWAWQPAYAELDPVNGGIYHPKTRWGNNHPGILGSALLTADTHGVHAAERAIELGSPYNAFTWHLVSAGIDSGPQIAEFLVPIEPGETAQDVFDKTQDVEKEQTARVVQSHLTKRAEHLGDY